MSNAEFQKLAQIKWQSDCLNKEKSGEIQWIMKRCPSRIPIDDMWRRFTSVLSYPVSSSSKRKERKEKYMFLWLTFFSQKCPLQNVSIQHIWCLLRKSSHFKRCLCLKGFFLYTSNTSKCEKKQLLICIHNQHNLEFVDSHTNKKGEPLEERIWACIGAGTKNTTSSGICAISYCTNMHFFITTACLGLIFC